MRRFSLGFTLVFWVIFVSAGFVWGEQKRAEDVSPRPGCELKSAGTDALPPSGLSETRHVLELADRKLAYVAVAGTLPVKIRKNGSRCRIFFVAYELEGIRAASRSLTFVFNGGPGASAAYLHLGALGPRTIEFGKEGTLPEPPVGSVENARTWLRFTDLVFVDPVGTGYSRCVTDCGSDKKGKEKSAAWGVEEDFTAMAEFVRLYLTRRGRWTSPKYLVGESYGGFRVAGLSGHLQSNGIGVNGMILISPVLEFGSLSEDSYRLLPWIVRVPSYAATARRHGKARGNLPENHVRTALEGVERFAVHDLLPALANGQAELPCEQLAGFIGMSDQAVERSDARIPLSLYVKNLLSSSRRLISVYDGSWTAIDPKPGYPFPPAEDPLLARINLLLAPAFNAYIREDLGFETDLHYKILNKTVSKKWNWKSGMKSEQGFVGAAEDLKTAMSLNENLRVLIAHGVFDLVTPYFGSVVVFRQMALDPSVASNFSLKVYEGGHMFYTHQRARFEFFEDARAFFGSHH